jgi:hypothetical protein
VINILEAINLVLVLVAALTFTDADRDLHRLTVKLLAVLQIQNANCVAYCRQLLHRNLACCGTIVLQIEPRKNLPAGTLSVQNAET